MDALKESVKYMLKIDNPSRNQIDFHNFIEKRINMMDKFIYGRDSMGDRDPSKAASGVAILQELLQDPLIEDGIRSGDCFAILVEFYYHQGNTWGGERLVSREFIHGWTWIEHNKNGTFI